MKLKKKLGLLLLGLTTAALLTACGGKSSDSASVTIDMNQLCEDLKGTINSELNTVSTDIAASTYFFDTDQVEECVAALNSGANACEIAILKCKDASYVDEAETLFKNRVTSQSDLFASYNAGEVAKLDEAILESTGSYVVFCVTDDTDAAKEIIKKAGF